MFAVIRTGGKQYRVAEQDLITVDKVAGEPGDAVQFGEVLLIGGESVVIGSPMVTGASVAGEVVEQGRGEKIIAFKKRRRKNSRRKRGHRQEFSLIRITEILTEGQKPKAKAEAAPRADQAAAKAARAEPAAPPPQASPAAPVAEAPARPAPQPEAKPAPARKADAKPKAEPAAEKVEAKPAKPKAAAKPAKKEAKPKAEKPAAVKKPAAKKPAAGKGKDKKK